MATKKENDILKNLPPSAGDFIKLVIKKMRYRKSVRRDVTAELTAHFEDELKDCKTEQEKEQKAKRLIEEFGDPKLLGILLRRAKKRCRPLWRTAVVRSLQTVVILIVCFIAYTVWFVTGKPVISTDYVAELNRIVRPAADESQNAFPLYDKAIQMIKADSDFNDVKILLGKRYEEANSVEKGKIEKLIAANKEVFDLIIAGSQKPYYWRTYQNRNPNSGVIGVMLPELAESRKIAQRLTWRARFSAEQGRFEDSFNDLTACYRFGRHIRQGNKILVEQLVGIAIESLSVQTLRDILATHKVDSASLKILQQNLEQAFANENFAINFKGEKLCMYDAIQRTFTEGALGGHICIGGLRYMSIISGVSNGSNNETSTIGVWLPKVGHVLFTHPGKKETQQMVDRFYNYSENIALKNPAQIHAEGIDVEKESMKIVKGNLLLEMLAPAINRVLDLNFRSKINIQATIAVIALQRYKEDKGQYPESLNDLIAAGYLKELPIDPWSDKTLVYKKTDTGFTLYSVGPDFKDDGGVPARDEKGKIQMWNNEKGDAVFWPVAK
jgi:hypothetical protein